MPSTSANDESNLWLPPRRMRRYEITKAVAGLFAMALLAWLTLQWSGVMRFAGVALVIITAWVTIGSIIADLRHARGRQVSIENDSLRIVDGENVKTINLAAIARGQWRDDVADETGLSFLDSDGVTLARLNTHFLADEAEARTFLGWFRRRTGHALHVDWPERA